MKWGAVGPVVAFGLLATAPAAGAATITVANTNDSGPGSLRAAVATVNTGSGGDTIVIPAGTIVLTSGELAVTQPVTITGAGAGSTTISGDKNSRIFDFQDLGPNSVSGVTLTAGTAQGGGAISAMGGTLTLSSIVASGNTATAGGGGAVDFGSKGTDTLTITGSSFSNNTAAIDSGAVSAGGGASTHDTITIRSSSFVDNAAPSDSGAVAAGGGGSSDDTITIDGSTFANNTTAGDSGGFSVSGGGGNTDTVSVTNTTITGNTVTGNTGNSAGMFSGAASTTLRNDTITGNSATGSSSKGGGISAPSTATVTNTIIAGNTAHTGANCVAPLTSQGHNIEGGANTCGFTSTGDTNADPKLGPLADNGGPTQTQALDPGSPAIDAGDNSTCTTTDQRGVPRPQGSACDIGAYEFAPPTVTTGAAKSLSQTTATISGTVTPNLRDTSYRFEFGTTTAYTGTTTAADAGAGSSSVPVTGQLTGLKPGTTYHYALMATNGDGTSLGGDRTFTTPPTPGVSALHVKPKQFAAKKIPHRHRKLGTTVTFDLNTAAAVIFRVQVARPGRLGAHHHCSAPNHANRSHRPCTRWVTLGGSLTIAGHAGANHFHFNGRLKGKTLKPGSYRFVADPVAGGIAGTGASVSFRIVL